MTGRTYVASPISTYETPRYDATLHRLRTLLPNAVLLPARDLFTSHQDWRDRWPTLLLTLDAVVFFDDDDGCIGAGVEREITDAWRTGIPVYFLTHPPLDRLIICDHTGRVEFRPVPAGGMRQTLQVEYAIPANELLIAMKGGT